MRADISDLHVGQFILANFTFFGGLGNIELVQTEYIYTLYLPINIKQQIHVKYERVQNSHVARWIFVLENSKLVKRFCFVS